MRKIFAALAAAGVLVLGAFTAAAVSRTSSAAAQDPSTDDSTSTTEVPATEERGRLLDDVLSGLVEDGVITQDQADAVADALAEKFEELRASRPGRFWRGHGIFGLRGMLDDGVIDAEELASLPDDHPLRDPEGPAAEFLEDGELTVEELGELAPHPGLGGRHGWWGGADESEDAESVESSSSA
ncbi:MAG TPA: hypothetical protein VGC47_05900 [Acidimicrobiia bacterium]|jgi:hypothetical protein